MSASIVAARTRLRESGWFWLLPSLAALALLALADRATPSLALCFGTTLPPAARASDAPAQHLLAWLLMLSAMTPPLLYPMARHVAARSFPERRVRAVGLLVLGYAGVWLAAFPAAFAALLALAAMTGRGVAVAAFLLAALWQVTPLKRRALARCHSVFPVRVSGAAADASCFAFGARHGAWCALSCLPMMAASLTAAPHLAAMLAVTAIAFAERGGRRPRPGSTAVLLALTGLAAAGARLAAGA